MRRPGRTWSEIRSLQSMGEQDFGNRARWVIRLTEGRRHSLRKDHDGEPSSYGVLKPVHAADDYCSLFVVSCADFVGPGVAALCPR